MELPGRGALTRGATTTRLMEAVCQVAARKFNKYSMMTLFGNRVLDGSTFFFSRYNLHANSSCARIYRSVFVMQQNSRRSESKIYSLAPLLYAQHSSSIFHFKLQLQLILGRAISVILRVTNACELRSLTVIGVKRRQINERERERERNRHRRPAENFALVGRDTAPLAR